MNSITIRGKTIKLPIIQGGMGVGVSRSSLASAVIKAGGMGVISASQIGFVHEDFYINVKHSYQANLRAIDEEVKKVREKVDGFLAVNILTASRQYAGLAKQAVESGVDAIISGAGLPFDMPKYTQGTNVANIPIVSSAKALKVIIRKWMMKYDTMPDAVIIEGPEAGGHLGVTYDEIGGSRPIPTLEEIFADVKKFCIENNYTFPILVAGGVWDGHDIRKFMDMGADGVQMATKFIATEECDADIKFKQAFIKATKDDIDYVSSPVGYPGRAIQNKFTTELKKGNIPVEKCLGCVLPCNGKVPETVYCITDKLIQSVKGDTENGLVFTGSNGYRIEKIIPVQQLMDDLVREYEEGPSV
ncbi:MAG: NAD(P)H-dependent flavin oxidoreductase [Mycoplasmatales bacterium]